MISLQRIAFIAVMHILSRLYMKMLLKNSTLKIFSSVLSIILPIQHFFLFENMCVTLEYFHHFTCSFFHILIFFSSFWFTFFKISWSAPKFEKVKHIEVITHHWPSEYPCNRAQTACRPNKIKLQLSLSGTKIRESEDDC